MVSNDLVDGFIPKDEMAQCNLCRKQSSEKPFTCEVYPDWIPKQKPVGTCPYYEPDEQKVKEQEAWEVEVKKMVAEMVARAEEKKRRQREQGSAAD